MTLGEKIKARRTELGMTQFDLAVKCGVTPPTILKWEKGITASIKSTKAQALADALEVSISWLMDWTDEENGKGNKHDPEVEALLERMHKDENIRVLLDSSADLTKDDLEFVIDMVNKLRNKTK